MYIFIINGFQFFLSKNLRTQYDAMHCTTDNYFVDYIFWFATKKSFLLLFLFILVVYLTSEWSYVPYCLYVYRNAFINHPHPQWKPNRFVRWLSFRSVSGLRSGFSVPSNLLNGNRRSTSS